LDDLPAGGTKTNRSTFPRIGTATIHLPNLIGKLGAVNAGADVAEKSSRISVNAKASAARHRQPPCGPARWRTPGRPT